MSDGLPQNFEEKLARIDAIVKDLDGGTVELKRATELFREGKTLVRECETILRNAQNEIDEAMTEPPRGAATTAAAQAPELDEELPF